MNEAASRSDGSDNGMPPWIGRAIALFFGAWTFTIVVWWVVGRLRDLFVLLLVSLFLSFALEPAVNRLARRGMRRGAATGLVFVGFLLLSAAFIVLMGSVVVDQGTRLVDEAPRYIEDVTVWLERRFDVRLDTDSLVSEFQDGGAVRDLATRLAGDLVNAGKQATTALFQMLTVMLFTFYLVADGPKLRRAVCSLLPPDRQREVLRIWDLAIDKTGGYIYSRSLLAVLAAGAHWAAFMVIGVPFPIPLAIWVGVLSQFVPTVGTYLAGVLPVAIMLLDDPRGAIWVAVFIAVYQQFENYILQPRITAHHLDMHPAVAFGSVIAGVSILGAVGALLAIPVGATAQSVISVYLSRHELVDPAEDDSPDTGQPRRDASSPTPEDGHRT